MQQPYMSPGGYGYSPQQPGIPPQNRFPGLSSYPMPPPPRFPQQQQPSPRSGFPPPSTRSDPSNFASSPQMHTSSAVSRSIPPPTGSQQQQSEVNPSPLASLSQLGPPDSGAAQQQKPPDASSSTTSPVPPPLPSFCHGPQPLTDQKQLPHPVQYQRLPGMMTQQMQQPKAPFYAQV